MPASPAYGVGLFYPIAPAGALRMVEGSDGVAQAIRTLLLTEPGERIGRPTYGVGLRRFLFQPNDASTRTLIGDAVTSSLREHEPRIALDSVAVTPADDVPTRIDIRIAYRLVGPAVAQSDPRNIVFPFHLDERGA